MGFIEQNRKKTGCAGMGVNYGYACINETLKPEGVSVNRGMIKKTFDLKGLEYVSQLVVQNLQDLMRILEWNSQRNILFYRMSSDTFPWMSEYQFEDLPAYSEIVVLLEKIGTFATDHQMRLTFHPGPFNVLASESEGVVKNTILELDHHAQIMDLMKLPETPFHKINIHLGTTCKGNKGRAFDNFCQNFFRLSPSTQKRLTIENDDKATMFSVKDLVENVHPQTSIPVVMDFHHHWLHPGGVGVKEALDMALNTWPKEVRPAVHYSEPKSFEDKKLLRAHSGYIQHTIPLFGREADVMIEAKEKEKAVLEYLRLKESGQLQPSINEVESAF